MLWPKLSLALSTIAFSACLVEPTDSPTNGPDPLASASSSIPSEGFDEGIGSVKNPGRQSSGASSQPADDAADSNDSADNASASASSSDGASTSGDDASAAEVVCEQKCENFLFCDGEGCDENGQCEDPCDDKNPLTWDFCNEATDSCTHLLVLPRDDAFFLCPCWDENGVLLFGDQAGKTLPQQTGCGVDFSNWNQGIDDEDEVEIFFDPNDPDDDDDSGVCEMDVESEEDDNGVIECEYEIEGGNVEAERVVNEAQAVACRQILRDLVDDE